MSPAATCFMPSGPPCGTRRTLRSASTAAAATERVAWYCQLRFTTSRAALTLAARTGSAPATASSSSSSSSPCSSMLPTISLLLLLRVWPVARPGDGCAAPPGAGWVASSSSRLPEHRLLSAVTSKLAAAAMGPGLSTWVEAMSFAEKGGSRRRRGALGRNEQPALFVGRGKEVEGGQSKVKRVAD